MATLFNNHIAAILNYVWWLLKVAVSLRDGSHSDLVKGMSEEAGKCAAEHHIMITTGHAHAYTNEVLFSNETL